MEGIISHAFTALQGETVRLGNSMYRQASRSELGAQASLPAPHRGLKMRHFWKRERLKLFPYPGAKETEIASPFLFPHPRDACMYVRVFACVLLKGCVCAHPCIRMQVEVRGCWQVSSSNSLYLDFLGRDFPVN